MRRALVTAVLILGAWGLSACATPLDPGPTVTQERDVSGADAVTLAGVGRLDVTIGPTASLEITAGERLMDRITSDVTDGTLVLDVRPGPNVGLGGIEYRLVLPTVESVTVSGAGDVDAKLDRSPSLSVLLAGAGDITAAGVDVDDLTVTVSGAGAVNLSGSADRQRVEISGLGGYRGAELTSGDADVLVSGAGSASVTVTGELDATVTGAGSITYAGSPTVTSTVTGVGSVREAE